MQIKDLLISQQVIQQFLNRKMPAKEARKWSKLTYALVKNQRLIEHELETVDKARVKLLAANWTKNEKTNKYDIPDKDQEKWEAMYEELLSGEADFTPYQVPFALIENIEITPGELYAISFIFTDLETDPAA